MKPLHYIGGLFFAVFLIYPLSIGPFVRFSRSIHTEGKMNAFITIYLPIFWLAQQEPQIERVLMWYTGLWLPNPKPQKPPATVPKNTKRIYLPPTTAPENVPQRENSN